jgi:hypothetical protein
MDIKIKFVKLKFKMLDLKKLLNIHKYNKYKSKINIFIVNSPKLNNTSKIYYNKININNVKNKYKLLPNIFKNKNNPLNQSISN